ncbi:hypothetical protein ACFE04_019850 [Oxalis oulophora]
MAAVHIAHVVWRPLLESYHTTCSHAHPMPWHATNLVFILAGNGWSINRLDTQTPATEYSQPPKKSCQISVPRPERWCWYLPPKRMLSALLFEPSAEAFCTGGVGTTLQNMDFIMIVSLRKAENTSRKLKAINHLIIN